jgi:hypothetical protein
MSGIKIQINSLEALERLIGGDTELEIDLRRTIVQEFTNKHLKALSKEIINECYKDLTRLVEREFAKHFEIEKYSGNFKLDKKYKERIQKEIEDFVDDEIFLKTEKERTAIQTQIIENLKKWIRTDRLTQEVDKLVTTKWNEVSKNILSKLKS